MLTETAVKAIRAIDKPQKFFDERGLFLFVSPAGGKLWRLKYRFDGKEKLLSLGKYPEITLKDARDRRDDARRKLANGIDPSSNAKAVKMATRSATENSFETVALEWFASYSPTKASSHTDRIMHRLKGDVFPWIGARPIDEITPPEVLAVAKRVQERGAVDTGHRVLTYCSQVFQYATATGRVPRDFVPDVRSALQARPPQGHLAAATDPAKIGELLRMFDGYIGGLVVRSALKLVPLLVVRPGELRRAEWKDFDLKAKEWRFMVTKTKTEHIVPLSRQAVAILEELHALTGNGRWVFPGLLPGRPMSDNAVLTAYRRLGIPPEELTGHGWRATFRTLGDEVLRFRIDLIEHQLAHNVKDPLGRAYNRTKFLEDRKEMMQQWADYLDGLKESDSDVMA